MGNCFVRVVTPSSGAGGCRSVVVVELVVNVHPKIDEWCSLHALDVNGTSIGILSLDIHSQVLIHV
jgi:hypothetical protein